MSAADVAVENYRNLQIEDLKTLQAIEKHSKRFQNVPQETIARSAGLSSEEVPFRLRHLSKRRLVTRHTGTYTGYHLTTAGYDTLAIDHLTKANFLEAFGKPVGVGKESDVYEALAPSNMQVAVKFHRLGRTSFKQTARKRGYGTSHKYSPDWHQQSKIAAGKEYKALRLLHARSVAVPKPIAHNRHVLVLSKIEGAELYRFKEIPNPDATLREILVNMRKTYQDANIIHGDLSPYNIILQPSNHILIIDWPQYVTRKHPNEEQLLRRDTQNILKFFRNKCEARIEIEQALIFIRQRCIKDYLLATGEV